MEFEYIDDFKLDPELDRELDKLVASRVNAKTKEDRVAATKELNDYLRGEDGPADFSPFVD
jgi:hypothetical protein